MESNKPFSYLVKKELSQLNTLKNKNLVKYELEGYLLPNHSSQVLTENEYIRLLKKCVALIPHDVVIHRLTGDGDKRILIAPLWSTDKKSVLNMLNRKIREAERRSRPARRRHYGNTSGI